MRAQPTIDVLLRIGKLGSSLCYGLPVSVFLAINLNSLPIESQFGPGRTPCVYGFSSVFEEKIN